jgi:hypothetical protein
MTIQTTNCLLSEVCNPLNKCHLVKTNVFYVPVTKHLRKSAFVSEPSPARWLLGCDKAEHHGREHMWNRAAPPMVERKQNGEEQKGPRSQMLFSDPLPPTRTPTPMFHHVPVAPSNQIHWWTDPLMRSEPHDPSPLSD